MISSSDSRCCNSESRQIGWAILGEHCRMSGATNLVTKSLKMVSQEWTRKDIAGPVLKHEPVPRIICGRLRNMFCSRQTAAFLTCASSKFEAYDIN